MKKTTLTIGIPAYNEEKNITKLVTTLLKQNLNKVLIKKIIISSDGSTDNTVKNLSKLGNKNVEIVSNRERRGVARGLNQISDMSSTDVLVTLDADILIKDNKFIMKLISPIILSVADVTSSVILDFNNKTYFSRILSFSMQIKEVLFKLFNNGFNMYQCRGLARAYSKRFYKEINYPVSIGNDMYLYLFSIKNKYKFESVKDAVAYYKLPANLQDHVKQSVRFNAAASEMSKYFSSDFLRNESSIDFATYVKAFASSLPMVIRNPIKFILYILTQLYVKIHILVKMPVGQTWDMVISSK